MDVCQQLILQVDMSVADLAGGTVAFDLF